MTTPSTPAKSPRCADCGTTEHVRRYEDLRDHQLVWLCPDSVDFSHHLSVPLDSDEVDGSGYTSGRYPEMFNGSEL